VNRPHATYPRSVLWPLAIGFDERNDCTAAELNRNPASHDVKKHFDPPALSQALNLAYPIRKRACGNAHQSSGP
jgi:hypothetical protein